MRQLALNLYGDTERRERGMPPRQTARAGVGLAGQAGYEWQDLKVSELENVFGVARVHVNPTREGGRPGTLVLADVLPDVVANQFVVEGRFEPDTDTFKRAIGVGDLVDLNGHPLGVGNAFPDIVQVLPPMVERPSWEEPEAEEGPDAMGMAVAPDGEVEPLALDDGRLRLRVIDIKQSAEPGSNYFAEVVYYSVALAGWLAENGYDGEFVVCAAPAVWPGSYEASALMGVKEECRREGREPSAEETAVALEEDIEVAPFDVFAPRLRRFFREELVRALQTPWDELPWHVSFLCANCEFLGYPWPGKDGEPSNDPRHCWPTAEREGHLSRVAGLSRGSAALLRQVVETVDVLADVDPSDPTFDASPTLRAKRTIYPQRALALRSNGAGVIPHSGGDALMPSWPDLHLYLFLDYDLASAVTGSFGVRAFWKEPLPFGSDLTPDSKRWAAVDSGKATKFQEVYVVGARTLEREKAELLKFLRSLRSILGEVVRRDDDDADAGRRGPTEKLTRSTYQIYLWDEAQRRHLARVVGRHLGAILDDSSLRDLAWLFPPPELLAHPDEASHRSPFTLVSNVVQNTVAVPVPHHYTLLEAVREYKPDHLAPLSVHPLYRDPMTDLVPSERLHELLDAARELDVYTGAAQGDDGEEADRARLLGQPSRKRSARALVSRLSPPGVRAASARFGLASDKRAVA